MNETIEIKKPWGKEEIWAKTDKYVGKIIYIDKGHKLSLQYHQKKEEDIRVLKGTLRLVFGYDRGILMNYKLEGGDSWHIPAGFLHRFWAYYDTDVILVEVSSPELGDVVRLEDSYGRIMGDLHE